MSFIKKVIGPDEQLIGVTTVHWIYGAQGLMWLASLMLFATAVNWGIGYASASITDESAFQALNLLSGYVFSICTLLGVVLFLLYFLMMITTEIGLTSKRVIFKRGWIFVSVKEVDLEEIKAADIDNGLLGRFLNYGYVNFDARFVQNMTLPAVADPYRFTKALNEAKSMLKKNSGSMNVVLDNGADTPGEVSIEKKSNGKSTKKARVETPDEPPAHRLEEKRYETTESMNPAQQIKNIAAETGEAIKGALPNAGFGGQQAGNSGPVIFPRDLKQHKEDLRRKIMSSFSALSRRKTPK